MPPAVPWWENYPQGTEIIWHPYCFPVVSVFLLHCAHFYCSIVWLCLDQVREACSFFCSRISWPWSTCDYLNGEYQLVLICTLSTTDRLADCLRPLIWLNGFELQRDTMPILVNLRPLQSPTRILTRAIRVQVDQHNIRGADDVIWNSIHGTWPYFNFVDFRAYFGPFSLVNRVQFSNADAGAWNSFLRLGIIFYGKLMHKDTKFC